MMPSGQMGIDAVDKQNNRCPECKGTGRVPVPDFLREILNTRVDTWKCLKCHRKGVLDADNR